MLVTDSIIISFPWLDSALVALQNICPPCVLTISFIMCNADLSAVAHSIDYQTLKMSGGRFSVTHAAN